MFQDFSKKCHVQIISYLAAFTDNLVHRYFPTSGP